MKIFRPLLICVFIISVAAPAFAGGRQGVGGGSVHVRGHFRRDGAYVQPHYRSAPDGRFYNNWSTKGNINPYTGEDGKVVSPPLSGSRGSYSLPAPSLIPPRSSDESSPPPLLRLPSTPTFSPSLDATLPSQESITDYLTRADREARLRQAKRLKELGIPADPEREDFLSMADKEARVRQSRRLHDLGYRVDWEKMSFLDMADMESRIRQAQRLKQKGVNVDWRRHAYMDLLDIELRMKEKNQHR